MRAITVSMLLLAVFTGPSLSMVSPSSRAQEVEIAAAIAFTEGPTVDRQGNVFFSDLVNNRILKLAVDGTLSTFRQPSNYANGLVFDAQWRLLACEAGDHAADTPPRVTRTNIQTGKVEVLADRYEGKLFAAPNDITFDGQGRVYFSDRRRPEMLPKVPAGVEKGAETVSAFGVYRIDADGRVTRLLAAPEIEAPNGLIISPDDRLLYLIEANQAEKGARMIRAYDLRADGSVAGMRVFHNFYPGRSGDGMAIDVQGNLYVAAGLHNRRGSSETLDTKPGVHVFSPAGALLKYIPIPEDTVTNCAFGGGDLKTLYVTAGKTLYRVRTEIEGTRR